ncbi:MAG TPA: GerMN domain-containing protein [Candidatus Goldiibacteriota bacterium]|nr:GerMN domain-containing protein [Candidatus Goldiibacteriota bacterium]
MINYKKNFKTVFLFIVVILLIYFLFFKIKPFGFKNNVRTSQNMIKLYSPDKKLINVVVFYGDPKTDRLKPFSTEIYEDGYVVNEVKQVLNKLFENPPQDYIRVIPEGTSVREVYIDANLTLYVDLSEEFMVNNKGGTTLEYLTVYSIIKSVFSNFLEIRGIKLLINGVEQETVSGHLNIIDIFRPDDAGL